MTDAMTNPLLRDLPLPDFAELRAEHVAPAITERLAQWQAAVDAVLADPQAVDFASAIAPIEQAADALSRSFSPVSHLHSVADSPELREAFLAALEQITAFNAELSQNQALYERFAAIAERPDFADLSLAQRAVVNDGLRDFRLGGVALEEPARTRFRQISTELARLQAEFEQAVTDASDAWQLPVNDEQTLAGLPAAALRTAKAEAERRELPGWVLTLRAPCYIAVMTHARDRQLRQTMYRAWQTRASDQGADPAHDNSERMEQILRLRHEAANLLGFDSAAHRSLATKMAGTPQEVIDFLNDLGARARPAAGIELDDLREFAASKLDLDELQPWDLSYAAERLKESRFGLSEDDLKPYLPMPRVLQGLFERCTALFGVRIVERPEVATWHPDARYFEVLDQGTNLPRAGFYLDPYARAGKRGGAWMDVCASRARFGQTAQLPIAYLTCNFAPPSGDQPALLTFEEVTTLFHEFGHGLHHMLTEVDWPRIGGISGVEWDAVELPSQFLENFCWERSVLDQFARHVDSGEKLPDELYQKLLATRHFHAGMWLVRQLEFALFDFQMHLHYDPQQGGRIYSTLEAVREQVAVVRPPEWTRFAHAFGHIFAGGYDAGYYSYLWAEVLSADAFAAFTEAGLDDPGTGARFRREILAVGASRPAAESFAAFRGREPKLEPLLASYGLQDAA